MKTGDIKKNKPELPVDYNGNAIQVWTVGGRTIHVNSGDFVAESSLIRVCSGDSTVKIKLKDLYPEDKDSGMPIPPNTVFCLGCYPGDVFSVEGEAYVTFVRDRSYKKEEEVKITPSILSQNKEKTGGHECNCIIDDHTIKFGGYIDFYYTDLFKKRYSPGNRVGIRIEPTVNIKDYSNLVVGTSEGNIFKTPSFIEEEGKYFFETELLVKKGCVPSVQYIVFDWEGNGKFVETFKVEILEGTILRNG